MPLPLPDSEAADLDACRVLLCEGSRSFKAAARLLPRAVHEPATALYAFCREADDAIDHGLNSKGRSASPAGRIDWLAERLALVYGGRPLPLPADRAFTRIIERFAIPRALPEAMLEGFAWDADGRRYADLPELRAYAVRVAGTVGAMMAVLMDVHDPERLSAAIDLGVAMQLSNIARDVGEDARAGRLYLPLNWLIESGIDPDRFLADPRHSPALGQVVRRLLHTANNHYLRAEAGIRQLPLSCRFGVCAARLLYAEIGREVGRRGFNSVSGRAVVSRRRKAWVLATGLGSVALPPQVLSREPLAEAMFLLDALPQTARRSTSAEMSQPRWVLAKKLHWTIDLFERLERRERVGT